MNVKKNDGVLWMWKIINTRNTFLIFDDTVKFTQGLKGLFLLNNLYKGYSMETPYNSQIPL